MLHKTPTEVGQVTLPQLDRLLTYWADHPPPGYARREDAPGAPSTEDEVQQLVRMVNGG